jgi:phosphopantothenoylcysteine decarboxylase/phosphopantothenate--cysteine ligase
VILVGFAAETDDVLTRGLRKLADKGCDLLVVNEVGEDKAFDLPDNAAVILGSDGTRTEVPYGPKESLAQQVWDRVAGLLSAR